MKRQTAILLIVCLLASVIQSCSGGSSGNPPVGNEGGKPVLPPAASGEFLDALLLRDASGKLSGIQVSWDPVADNAAEAVSGYHIYQSSSSIPDASRGDSTLWLEDDSFGADGSGKHTIFP